MRRPDAPPVAVLRHRAWVSYFGSDPGVVGTTIRLNGEPRTIVGVMPPRFTWHAADLYIPGAIDRNAPDARTAPRNFQARLKPGLTLQEAEAQINVIAARRARTHPEEYPENFHVRVVNVIDEVVGDFRSVLYTALAAVALLMLIACCNVANMLLARATAREREMTVRAALGAGRGRIVRQLLVESLLLALCGGRRGDDEHPSVQGRGYERNRNTGRCRRQARDGTGPVFQRRVFPDRRCAAAARAGIAEPGRRRATPDGRGQPSARRQLLRRRGSHREAHRADRAVRRARPARAEAVRDRRSRRRREERRHPTTACAAGVPSGCDDGWLALRFSCARLPIRWPLSTRYAASSGESIAGWLSGSRTRSRS